MEEVYVEGEFIDFSKYWKRLIGHWKTIVCWGVGAFAFGCVVALCASRKYTVVSELAPELSSTATNRLSSLASYMGLSATMLGTTDAMYPMVYPDLVKSSEFMADMFEVPVTFEEKGDSLTATLYEYMTEHRSRNLINMLLPPPRKYPEEPVDPFHFTKNQGKVVKRLSKCIAAGIDNKTLVVSVSVTMPDAVVAATVARAVNRNLRDYVTEYRTQKAIEDCRYYEKLYQEAQDAYYEALRVYSDYSDSHQGVSLRRYMIESERLKNEASLKYNLYNTTAQQLQTARSRVQQETPVFVEIIPPTVPQKPSNSKRKTAMIFGALGGVLGCCYVLWRYRKEEFDGGGETRGKC